MQLKCGIISAIVAIIQGITVEGNMAYVNSKLEGSGDRLPGFKF